MTGDINDVIRLEISAFTSFHSCVGSGRGEGGKVRGVLGGGGGGGGGKKKSKKKEKRI